MAGSPTKEGLGRCLNFEAWRGLGVSRVSSAKVIIVIRGFEIAGGGASDRSGTHAGKLIKQSDWSRGSSLRLCCRQLRP